MIPAIALMGPTASGKTALALLLADAFPVDIISVDSVLVYRHFDIGTAKPDPELRARYPHALVDIREPDQPYSAGSFRQDALAEIAAARGRGRIPLLVGGSGLYFRALERGIGVLPTADPQFRRCLSEEGAALGWPALHQRLAALDPVTAGQIATHDRQRIQRALELIHHTGKPLAGQRQWQGEFPGALRKIVLQGPRGWLHQRIEQRLQAMLAAGFLDELRHLQAQRYAPELPAMRAVGYRQLMPYLEGLCPLPEALAAAAAATRQLAKRQETWLRQESRDLTLDPSEETAANSLCVAVGDWLAMAGYPHFRPWGH